MLLNLQFYSSFLDCLNFFIINFYLNFLFRNLLIVCLAPKKMNYESSKIHKIRDMFSPLKLRKFRNFFCIILLFVY